MELRRSWIVGLIEAAEKGNRKRQLEAASLAVSNRSNILTIRAQFKRLYRNCPGRKNPAQSCLVSQVDHEVVGLALLATDDHQRLAEVGLRCPRSMHQRNEHLPAAQRRVVPLRQSGRPPLSDTARFKGSSELIPQQRQGWGLGKGRRLSSFPRHLCGRFLPPTGRRM